MTGAAGPAASSDSSAPVDAARIASRPRTHGRESPWALAFFALVFSLAGSLTRGQSGSGPLVGGSFPYQVKRGDSLTLLGARFGVEPRFLARANGLSPQARLSIGQSLRVENRHIVPDAGDGILINVPQRLLFLFHEGSLAAWYPVALGRPDWQTATHRDRLRAGPPCAPAGRRGLSRGQPGHLWTSGELRALFEAAAARRNVLDTVDPARVEVVLADRAGIDERIDHARGSDPIGSFRSPYPRLDCRRR